MDSPHRKSRPVRTPMVSVIIPVRDDPDGIKRVLDCLAEQTFPRECFEVVIGDDGSQPGLEPRVPESDQRLRRVSTPALTSYAARNSAVQSARGEILAFCDADCLPAPDWLERGSSALEDADVVAGEVVFRPPERPTVWTLLTVDLFLDQRQNARLSRGVTANLMVRRKDFESLGGFDQSLPSGGDYDFVKRAVDKGARLRYDPRVVVGHPTMNEARPFLKKIFRTNFWSGFRHARNRDRMDVTGILALVPVLGVMLARKRVFRPAFSLQGDRLSCAGVRSTRSMRLLAVAALYFVVYFVAGTGRALGWLRGMKMARSGLNAVYLHDGQAAGPKSSRSNGACLWS